LERRHTMKAKLPKFDGKVVSVVCVNEDTGQLIRSPRFENQGGRLFIVGTVPEDASQDNWMEDLPCAIAWDTVQDYVIFDSMEDYLNRLNSRRKRWKRSNKPAQRTRASRFAKGRDGTS
jgi:hypothetical protein